MARHDARDAHSVRFGNIDEISNGVSRVNHYTLASVSVAYQVGEVDHLLGNGVIDAKVSTTE